MNRIVTFSLTVIALSGCAGENAVKKVLEKNPEIIFNAIEKNPGKFMESVQKASRAAQGEMQAKAQEEEKKKLDDDIKNPKKPEITPGRAFRGKADAPILLVEYSDFQCPYCKRGYQTVEELRKKYGDKIGFTFKHLPLDFHPLAMPAAKRFEALALQGSEIAYKFHDHVFENQEKLGTGKEKFLDEAAKKAGGDVAKMKKDMDSEEVTKRIEADMKEAKSFDISGTPGFIVAGVALRGAYPIDKFEEIIKKNRGGE